MAWKTRHRMITSTEVVNATYSPSSRKQRTKRTFWGVVVDTGAPTSVIGRKEAELYCKMFGMRLQVSAPQRNRIFKFGTQTYHSIGEMSIIIPITDFPFCIRAPVLLLDIPLLIGLDMMRELRLSRCPSDCCLIHVDTGNKYPLKNDEHLVLQWSALPITSFYTKGQIRRLHKHFIHPSASKLYELLRKASSNELESDIRKLIEEISRSCATCAEINDRPVSFSVRTPDSVIFNQQLLIGIMYYNSRPIIHIVDRGTRFSEARYLRRADAMTFWNIFVQAWSFLYMEHPSSILTDQDSVFMSDQWKGMCCASDIKIQTTGVESHNSLNAGESLHASPRQILRRLERDHSELTDQGHLATAVYIMNRTVNVDGICPMLLVFGMMPPISTLTGILPSHAERIRAMKAARDEYSKIVAKQRINRAKQIRPPPSSESNISPGDVVYVYREKPKQWVGPITCIYREGKHVLVDISGTLKSFNISQLKRDDIHIPSLIERAYITEIIEKDDPRAQGLPLQNGKK